MNVLKTNAIATLLTTDHFLPGALALMYSLYVHIPENSSAEIVILVTPNISSETKRSLSFLSNRVVVVDPIPIPTLNDINQCHERSWTETGYTKLNIFKLSEYRKILYIDCDCIVQSDVMHLFDIDHDKSRGLLAAAPDIFPPDKFNAGVMLIEPSTATFEDLIGKISTNFSYDGGDTGFLNAYFDDWYSYAKEGRLSFAYNAQRFMHQCTYKKQPMYWNIGVGTPVIIHYSSNPKPWQNLIYENTFASSFLSQSDLVAIRNIGKASVLDDIWRNYYEKGIKYLRKRLPDKIQMPKMIDFDVILRNSTKDKSLSHSYALTHYKELRKKGVIPKDAMIQITKALHQDHTDSEIVEKRVAAMFGIQQS